MSKPYAEARKEAIGNFEAGYVEQLLEDCEGNVSRAARVAGLDRVYLHRLIRRHELHGKTRGKGRPVSAELSGQACGVRVPVFVDSHGVLVELRGCAPGPMGPDDFGGSDF